MGSKIYKTPVGRSTRRLFFMNGKLYKKLHIYRAGNLVYAWDYEDHKRVTFLHTDVKNLSNKAYSTPEVAEMLGVHRQTINRVIKSGDIKEPIKPYPLSNPDDHWHNAPYVWSKEDILDLHECLVSKNWKGRQSKYFMSNRPLPNRIELIAMLDQGTVLYTKNKDGEFIPVWKAPEW